MYFRILVNQNGNKFFRTSRIPTPGKADLLRSMFVEAFPASEGYEVEVLAATEPNGAIITPDTLTKLCAEA